MVEQLWLRVNDASCRCDIMQVPSTDAADAKRRQTKVRLHIANESVPIQLAQCRFAGLAISNDKILIFFRIKYVEEIFRIALGNCYALKLPKC